jgi:hypothetical protein
VPPGRGEQAGVILQPHVQEHVKDPLAPRDDRERRSSKAEHLLTADLFEQIDGAAEVVAELLGRQLIALAVPVGMGGDFVTGRRDELHQVRIPLGDPADDEERRPYVGVGDRLDDPLGVTLHDRLETGPGGRVLQGGDADHVEPVFDVEGQGVDNARIVGTCNHGR